ncbi:iron-sulfur cluster repair di-iron protein [Roseivirga sp. UBA1976]|uniref:iron-sulfur cluster repair di-iron protein n=1 Tax=Roseivirga sp. UBA1976 TaxID=1947386 RepID=UPI00257C90C6|nr:iron-sulfur cluster repair di-iron protein [Roseivirga sp. UBA1976]|tara:strand:- start:681 stop:1406 length:726 start_codon:yes stop_codon:yes gene_type:complete
MKTLFEKTVGEIVAEDYRTASVFESFGIDFCCRGNRPLKDACNESEVSKGTLKQALEALNRQPTGEKTEYDQWPIDLLCDYIEKKHHRYVEEKLPVIKQYLAKIVSVHGAQHPELSTIESLFNASAGELAMHMKKEELILFPFIRRMMTSKSEEIKERPPHFGTIENPVQTMMHEHDTEGERFRQIKKLSNSYVPPPDACNTYMVTYALLKEFEEDLHLHIHLENNILFPKAIAMEKQLTT